MRDNHVGLAEILGASEENAKHFGVVQLEQDGERRRFRFGLSQDGYLSFKENPAAAAVRPVAGCVVSLVSGTYTEGVTVFEPGGKVVWYSSSDAHLACSLSVPCFYQGTWQSLTLTVHDLPDGSVYSSLEGVAVGTYQDEFNQNALSNVRALYHQDSANLACADPGKCGSTWGEGGLTINTAGVLP